ncbi:MAG: DMT family transporter [Patescibacteria group bacterium]
MTQKFKYTFLAALSWAIAIIIARFIYIGGGNAYNVAFWTTIFSVPFWGIVFLKQKEAAKKITRYDLTILLGMGLISTVGIGITEALALRYSQAINYSFLIRTVILFTFLFAYIFLGEKLTLKKIVLAIVILFGSYLLIAQGQKLVFSAGDIFTLIEAALIALGNTVLGKMAVKRMSPNLSAAAAYLIGVIPLSLIALFNHAVYWPKSIALIILLAGAYIVLTLFRFRAYQYASAAYLTMMYSLTPVFVSLMAMTLLKETMTPIQLLGGGLIVLAGIAVEKLKI